MKKEGLTKEAIVLSRTIRPSALAAEKTHTSQIKLGLVRSSLMLGQKSPTAEEATEAATAIKHAKTLVQIIWSRTGESGPNGSEDEGFLPNTRSWVVLTRPSKKR